MELYTWPFSEKTLTLDSDSLIVLTYIRIGNLPVHLFDQALNPSYSCFTRLPLIAHAEHHVTGVEKILEYFRQENYGLEYELSEFDVVRMKAVVDRIDNKLLPALRWFLWREADVYHKHTKKYYNETMGFLRGILYTNRWRHVVLNECRTSHLSLCLAKAAVTDARVEETIYRSGRETLTALSHMLGQSQYFLGDTATMVDAYVFGRLAPLLQVDAQRSDPDSEPHPLIKHLYGCKNLIEHCKRIKEAFFPQAGSAIRTSHSFTLHSGDPDKETRVYRDCLLFAAIAFALTYAYASQTGLLRLEFGDNKAY